MKVELTALTLPVGKCLGMSLEEYIIFNARLSSDERLNNETAPKLLRFLIDSKHWSPLDLASLSFEIVTSRAISQQMLRHSSFKFQEFSQRYAEVTDIEPIQLRWKATKNRQSSTDVVDDLYLVQVAANAIRVAEEAYGELVRAGVATESARFVLPLATQTTIVLHGTLRSWIHFFEQRCSDHAQLEIQDIAYEVRKVMSIECPWVAEALGWRKDTNENN